MSLKLRFDSRPQLPLLKYPSARDFSELSSIFEGGSLAGFRFAAARGFLRVSPLRRGRAWALVDVTRGLCHLGGLSVVTAQLWKGRGYDWPGSWMEWPLGTVESNSFPRVALVTSPADFFTACHFIIRERTEKTCAPVALLSSRGLIASDALLWFREKRVRIFSRSESRAAQLKKQLTAARADWVEVMSLEGLSRADGRPVRSLCDVPLMKAFDVREEPSLATLTTF